MSINYWTDILMKNKRIFSDGIRFARKYVVLGSALVLVTACAKLETPQYTYPASYTERHPIVLTEGSETMDIPVGIHSDSLNDAGRQMVKAFAESYYQHNARVVQVLVPSGSKNESNARRTASHVVSLLKSFGIRASAIERRAYHVSEPGAMPPVRLAHPRIVAEVPECGLWPENVAINSQNRQYFNFGCAHQANLAAIVANPADLVTPRGTAPVDTTRATADIDNVRADRDPSTIFNTLTNTSDASEVAQ